MTKREPDVGHGERAPRRPLVSAFSILILSGFLIQAALTRFVSGDLQDYALYVGVLGMFAFIGLDQVQNRRRRWAEAAGQRFVEGRLAKHVDRCTSSLESAARP